ncbi:MurR/RpiR family transcriptional regulator [Paracoccus alkanivorans]|uniref:MurR/RpiR family transcriptional regulator n=1 Tax=Paracoccus alkanivorans TaxID=2116655 RepID=A0A3M0MIL4_9RHOB|nr:MurR/RpiR family transcriptional regulator [Paracoccus alkanivorans]RMC37265.1 MurR/RpiR family transcriptional regulator [Paracoccus alkanivorans]
MTENNPPPAELIEDRLARHFETLTPSERMLASHLTRHYPVAGLGSMPQLAKEAGVSTPTVLRLVQKLGFRGYPEFQAQLRAEVEARLESPLAKRARWSDGVPQTHMLNRFADAVLTNLSVTLGRIDHAEFDACAAMLADQQRNIFVTGGRITHALADYLVTQLGIVRPGVSLLPPLSNAWPPALLDLRPGDVMVVFDIRRYENSILELAELAAESGAEIVLMTDPWVSPVAAHAKFRFSAQIEVPSAWDSSVAMLLLLETLLAVVQEQTWPETEARMKRLEELYENTRLFRRGRSGEGRAGRSVAQRNAVSSK